MGRCFFERGEDMDNCLCVAFGTLWIVLHSSPTCGNSKVKCRYHVQPSWKNIHKRAIVEILQLWITWNLHSGGLLKKAFFKKYHCSEKQKLLRSIKSVSMSCTFKIWWSCFALYMCILAFWGRYCAFQIEVAFRWIVFIYLLSKFPALIYHMLGPGTDIQT